MVTIPVDEITTNLDQVGLNTLFLQFILFEVLVVLIIALLYLWLILLHDKKERAVDKAKTEFVSLASHQLRTPLTSIGWYSELLMKEKSEMSEKVLGFIEKIAHANSRMVELVSSLLDVSRLELGTFAITPVKVNVSNILTIVLDELKPLIEKKQMHIEQKSEEHLSLIADEKLFTMILQNLISNAVKYTPAEGTVKINIRKINNNLQIDISDNGIGVTAEDKNRMFTKLFRAANAIKTETDGTGLGLYIVKQAVERLGGTIGFNSELGKGTIFNVTLPITENKI
jgi:two-component system phosphate regulon sensor histidine kinase PhoR